jgi:transposase
MRKIIEVLRHHYELGHTNRTIGQSLNISPGSVSHYLNRAKAAGISWPISPEMTEEKLYEHLFLPSIRQGKNRPLPDWAKVHQDYRKKGVTLLLLWRDYREVYADGLAYSQFCHHYERYVKQMSPVMRQRHNAGEKTFVDYAGMTVPWIDSSTGEIHEAQIFVGSLGASQYTFVGHRQLIYLLP